MPLIRLAEDRRYLANMHHELLDHKDQIENHEKYDEKKAEEIRTDMDVVIKSQTSSLRVAEANAKQNEEKLKEHEEKFVVFVRL